jgi:hypothetical protein
MPMMKCGHASQAKTGDGRDICVICYIISPGADEVDTNAPDLTGRIAKCSDCGQTTESSDNLPYFKYEGGEGPDSYYSGCRGWN